MIVEFVGPAGAGKTTFAHALCRQLRKHGQTATVVLTYQPGGKQSRLDPGGMVSALLRVANAIADPIVIGCRPFANAVIFRIAASLVRTLPPRNAMWLARFSQYVLRLAYVWNQSLARDEVVIFDQAFVQAVASLALFNGTADEVALAHALEIIPRSDLVVRIDAPQELREARLNDRRRRQNFAERLFEAGLSTNLKSAAVVERVIELLKAGGDCSIIEIDASDERPLDRTIGAIENEILARTGGLAGRNAAS
ncbi:AAA family ATPase [Mesorhizobium sp.]|uniref:AAA family ATPase n=1 Tax=Mesorhizobium sp. TaxID=1871066 RepID=UPI0025E8D16E|nr:AAA family ATPase [Mesorhizobium sp.]